MKSLDFLKPPCRRKDLNLARTLEPTRTSKNITMNKRPALWLTCLAAHFFILAGAASATTFKVDVWGMGGRDIFSPSFVNIQAGDTVKWTWKGSRHSVGSASASVGILVGDVIGNGHVGNGDIGNVQSHLGQQTDSSNFRDDVTVDGRINNQDVQTVRSYRSSFLP